MAWQVAIVADDETSLGSLIGWLPIWTWSTPNHLAAAPELRDSFGKIWEPEPALTMIQTSIEDDIVSSIEPIIPTIEEHHPRLTALRLFGLENSAELDSALRPHGYAYKSESEIDGLLYVRPMNRLGEIPEVVIDASGWKNFDDVYDAFFSAVGAPDWHGRNFNALIDSIATGRVNKIEVPCSIVIRNSDCAKLEAAEFLGRFADLIKEMAERGCPVGIQIKR